MNPASINVCVCVSGAGLCGAGQSEMYKALRSIVGKWDTSTQLVIARTACFNLNMLWSRETQVRDSRSS